MIIIVYLYFAGRWAGYCRPNLACTTKSHCG